MRKPKFAICALVALVAALYLAACSSNTGTVPTLAPQPATPTLPVAPTVVATATPAPTPLPTVDPPALKLRLVNVGSGASTDLPIGFGGFDRSRAWSRDSTRIAVANDEGLSVGAVSAQRFTLLRAGSCFGVDWSPTQDQIAVGCKGGVAIVSSGGGVIMGDADSFAEWVRWAPDGRAVAYGSKNAPITVMALDGTRKTVPGSFVSAQWLPDGRLLTVEQPDYRDAATIRIHDPAKAYAVVATAVTRAGAASLGIDRDGRQAAYAVLGTPSASGVPRILPSTIFFLRIADGEETATVSGYPGYNALDFTPDGRSLLLQTGSCGSNWSIGVGALDGTVRSITPGGFMVGKFSPDGSQVGFTRGTELWVVASDGNTPARRLAEGIHGPAGFDWSPDSKWISVPPFFGGFDWCP